MEISNEEPASPLPKVVKSDAEWKSELSPTQYHILRESGTERPNGEAYVEFKHHAEGTYHCAGCGTHLFSSAQKFDSGCGWPSFYDPAKADHVLLHNDLTVGMVRTEVTCAVCGGHLGHVFDGEGYLTPTNKRYCINAGGLRFISAVI